MKRKKRRTPELAPGADYELTIRIDEERYAQLQELLEQYDEGTEPETAVKEAITIAVAVCRTLKLFEALRKR